MFMLFNTYFWQTCDIFCFKTDFKCQSVKCAILTNTCNFYIFWVTSFIRDKVATETLHH